MKAPYPPWSQLFENCAEKTWAKTEILDGNTEILKYSGKALPKILVRVILFIQSRSRLRSIWFHRNFMIPRARIQGDTIIVDLYDTWKSMFKKFIGALAWILENKEFDYLVRINSTAYINIEELRKFLDTGVDYAGPSNGKKFASGWAIVLSRNAAKQIVEYENTSNFMVIENDDKMIGDLMKKTDTKIRFFSAIDYHENLLWNKKRLESFVMIRIKHDSTNRNFFDADAFTKLHLALRVN